MTKRIVYSLAIIALIILMVMGGVYWWLTSTDLSSITHTIEKLVEEKTGREVSIQGGVSVYPGIRSTIVLKEVNFSNAKWAKEKYLFSAKKIVLTLSSWSLLKGEKRLSKINIIGLDAHLQTQDNGENNWDALFNQSTSDSDKPLSFKQLLITDGHIAYNVNQQLAIKNAAFNVNHSDKAVVIRMLGTLNKEALQIKGKVTELDNINKKMVPINFTMQLGNIHLLLKGQMSNDITAATPWLKANIKMKATKLSDINGLLHLHLPPVKPAYLTTQIMAQGDNYTLNKLVANIGETTFKGKINLEKQQNLEIWRLDLTGKSADAGSFLKQLGVTNKMQGGTFYVDADVWTDGNTLAAKKNRLNGTANLGIYNANLDNESNPNVAKEFVSVLAGTNMPAHIPINCLIAGFTIEKGVATANALVFDTKGATVAGKGSVNLPNNNVDITLKLYKKGLSITPLKTPFHVKGPLDNLSILPGLSSGTVLGVVLSAATGVGFVGFLAANIAENLGGSMLNRSACGKLLQKSTS
ncbi:MAG: AsmA family protein [Gammaproteobacteria bacterium]